MDDAAHFTAEVGLDWDDVAAVWRVTIDSWAASLPAEDDRNS